MKILLIVPNYPNENSSAYQFVHDRAKEYKKKFDVVVFCFNNNFERSYTFGNIFVTGGNEKNLRQYINKNKFDRFVFHFLSLSNARFIKKHMKDKKIYIWFHGSDCISYKRRLSKINYSKEKLKNPRFLFKYMLFIFYYKYKEILIKLINKKYNSTFVFVSKWLKNTSEEDLNIKYNNAFVIPNYINEQIFKYQKKQENIRYNILSINNYSSDIYGGDIARDIILSFSNSKIFKKFNFTIYGQGILFDDYTKDLVNFDNVSIIKKNLNYDEIKQLHDQNGIFLYPKRGDSQGVSRCEAMASGLVSVASNIEAISEFSPADTTYLVNTVEDFIKAFKQIDKNPKEFLKKSSIGSNYIGNICSYKNTIQKEIDLLSEV